MSEQNRFKDRGFLLEPLIFEKQKTDRDILYRRFKWQIKNRKIYCPNICFDPNWTKCLKLVNWKWCATLPGFLNGITASTPLSIHWVPAP